MTINTHSASKAFGNKLSGKYAKVTPATSGFISSVTNDSTGRPKTAIVQIVGGTSISVPVPYGSNIFPGISVSLVNDGSPSLASWRIANSSSASPVLVGGQIVNQNGSIIANFDSIWVKDRGYIMAGGFEDILGDPTGPRVMLNEYGLFGYAIPFPEPVVSIATIESDNLHVGDVLIGYQRPSHANFLVSPEQGLIQFSVDNAPFLTINGGTGNRLEDYLWIGPSSGPQVGMGKMLGVAEFAMRDTDNRYVFLVRSDPMRVQIGATSDAEGMLWDNGRLTVRGSVEITGGLLFGNITIQENGALVWAGGKGVADASGIRHVESVTSSWRVEPNSNEFMRIDTAGDESNVGFSIITSGFGNGIQAASDAGKAVGGSTYQGTGIFGIASGANGVGVMAEAMDFATTAFVANGISKLGDGGSTNYAQFAADGTLTMHGTATIASEGTAANAIPHAGTLTLPQAMEYVGGDKYNVKAFGVKGDGSTDDQPSLELAWNALNDGDTLVLPAGIYVVSDTVDWKGKSAITILAHNATIKPKTGVSFANKTVLDMRGSQYCNVVGLRIDCDLIANLPDVGLELHRTVDVVDGGANKFDNCWFSGSYDVAVVFDKGSELTSFWHCRFLTSVAGIPCYFTTSVDASQTAGVVSNVCKRFYDCTFLDYSNTATGQLLILIEGVSKELSFRDCYCALSGTGDVIRLSGTGASMYGLVLDNLRVEGPNSDQAVSRLLRLGQDNAASNCMISGITWTIDSDYVIEIDSTSALRASQLTLLYPLAGTTKWIHVSNNLQYNHIVLFGAETISIDSGDSAYCNYIVAFGSGTVFAGAGSSDVWPRQDNIVAMLYDSVSSLSAARGGVSGSVIDGHSATPAVAASSQIDLQQDAPTTITSFTGMIGGQEVTLLATNGNTTIAHGSAIKLSGATNWTLPAWATLTLKYFAKYSTWYEVGRMDPS